MRFSPEQLKKDLQNKRVFDKVMSMDEACVEIGISKATLSRAENEKGIDMDTFAKICTWLKSNPARYFRVSPKK
jgi:DNA-binding Xre family transcriptional regulator